MTLIESGSWHTTHGENHDSRIHGLISAVLLPTCRVETPDFQEIEAFDGKSILADGGWVTFRGRVVRVDHFIEHGNEVRSVVEPLQTNAEGYTLCRTVNLITNPDDDTYLEVHPSIECPDGTLWEPEVGSPYITPGEHLDIVLHYQVADEATPLSTAA